MDETRVTEADLELSRRLAEFIQKSPSPFHTVRQVRDRLDCAGFTYLPEHREWNLAPGGRYYTTRNGSSIVAFLVGGEIEELRFQIAASHSDSPALKLKANGELGGPGPYGRANVEVYGGAIDRSWLDRPLSIAGRVMVSEGGHVRSRLLDLDRDVLLVPSLAIHLDRNVNSNGAIDRAKDIYPLFTSGTYGVGAIDDLVAEAVGVERERVLARDLYVVCRQAPSLWGAGNEFLSAPRLDDLQCAYASLRAFLDADNKRSVSVYACFDNEEVGSGTMQGACSTFLRDVLVRACACLGYGQEAYRRAVAQSVLVSCDNAHAVHPNHPELYDEGNRAWLNRGVVIKETASQRYATEAYSRAFFVEMCRRSGVPTQSFANRSDMPGGSTLGNLLMRQVSLHGVDVGLPQLAMHSAYETAGVCDTAHLVRALSAFYDADYVIGDDDSILFL